jgi:hypothetical protein
METRRTCKCCAYYPCMLRIAADFAPKCQKFKPADKKRQIINIAGIRIPKIRRLKGY